MVVKAGYKLIPILFALALLLVPAGAAAQEEDAQKQEPPPLSEKHRKWLEEEVVYIISDVEKDAFKSMMTEAERDKFIAAFWDWRDPTPGTRENEFKEEHYKRIAYANRRFGRDTAKPGWKTARGRFHVLLGEPRFRSEYPEDMYVQPMELWHYISVDEYGLPPSFYVIFFRDYGVGEMRLYSPTSDGLQKLLRPLQSFQSMSNEELTDFIFTDVDPEVAHAIWSLLPSEGGLATDGFTPNPLASEMMLARISDARNYPPNYEWVDGFLRTGTSVKVEYSFLKTSPQSFFTWLQNSHGLLELHYAIMLRPEQFTLGRFEDRVYGSVTVDGFVTSAEGTTLAPIMEHSEFDVPDRQVSDVSRMPFELTGIVPTIPGDHKINLMWKNEVSRQNMPVHAEVSIPDVGELEAPVFSPPILLLRMQNLQPAEVESAVRPFQIGSYQFTPDVYGVIQVGNPIRVFIQLVMPGEYELSVADYTVDFRILKEDQIAHTKSYPLSNFFMGDTLYTSIGILQQIDSAGVASGDYNLRVALMKGEEQIALSDPMKFTMGNRELRDPWVIRRGLPPYNRGFHATARAEQFFRIGERDKAIAMLREAVEREPTLTDTKILLMRLLIQEKKFDEAIAIGEPLLIEKPRDVQLLILVASSYLGTGRDRDAVRLLERALTEQENNLAVLNLLAHAAYVSGDLDRAMQAVEKSLTIHPEQKNIVELKNAIEASRQ